MSAEPNLGAWVGLVALVAAASAGCDNSLAPSEPTVSAPAPAIKAPEQAFPTAQGYGASALETCDRKLLQVFPVTSLGDRGAGTLRAAMTAAEEAPRGALSIVVFRIAGYVDLQSPVRFSGDCLYVAGQSAPGDGVTLRNHGLEFNGDARDIVVRYLRVRLGASGAGDGILVRRGERYVFDHLSLSWAPSALVRLARTQTSSSGPIQHVSIQRTIFGESLNGAPVALQIGGEPSDDEGTTEAGWRTNRYHSVHHNLFVSNSHRNPNAQGLYTEVVNNVIHNWNLDGGQTGRDAIVDFIANYFQFGPLSRFGTPPIGVDERGITSPPHYAPSLYVEGNIADDGGGHLAGTNNPEADNWEGPARVVGWYRSRPNAEPIPQFRRVERLAEIAAGPRVPVEVTDARSARASVLADVGASRRLDCHGDWVTMIDAVDHRLILETTLGSGWTIRPGPITELEVGGFPELSHGDPCLDSNGDGLPDAWKELHGFDPMDDSIAAQVGGDGSSLLESYLNGTAPVTR